MAAVAALTVLLLIGGKNDGTTADVERTLDLRGLAEASAGSVEVDYGGVVGIAIRQPDPPSPAPVEPVVSAPEPIAVEPAPTEAPYVPLAGIPALIASYDWEDSIALRVFACESGPDYIAGFNSSGHAGTTQISPIHAWRFAQRSLNFWEHALIPEYNLAVAYEIWTERWWYAWSCF